MAESLASGVKPEKASSSNDGSKTIVSTTDFGLTVRITDFSDGSQACDVGDVKIVNASSDPVPEVPAAFPQKNAPVAAVPAATPVEAAAPRVLPTGKEGECSVCAALANALKEQVAKSAPSTPAPRRLPSSAGRRFVKS